MPQNLTEIIEIITNLLRIATPVVAALALLFFFWGVAQFILAAADTETRKKAQSRIIWGLISLFVILSVAALVTILQNTFFGTPTTTNTNLDATGPPLNISPFTIPD